MEPGRLITRPYGATLRLQDDGPPSRKGSRASTDDSPTSEYSTPLGSPVGRSFPQHVTDSQPSPSRGVPQRPPRPSNVMPMQPAKIRNYHLPTRANSRSNEELGQSAGSLRKPTLPPPSSRPGASPYAAPRSFSPILEESPDSSKRHASVASSRVVPSSWGSHPDDYNFDRMRERFQDEEDWRQTSASPDSQVSLQDDTASLVRQASMGKKMKPSSIKIRSGSQSSQSGRKKGVMGLGTIAAGVAAGAVGSGKKRSHSSLRSPSLETSGNRTIIIDSSSDSRRSSQDSLSKSSPLDISRSRSPLASPADRSAQQAGTLNTNRPVSHSPSMNEKIAVDQRSLTLDMDAVKKSEARGSATSLPDLIRRATKLAANLDRGKTASRQGLLDLADAEKRDRRRSGSMSDILASFPPPSRGTPEGGRYSRFPSPFSPSKLNQRMSYLTSRDSGSTRMPGRRRCCGMPLWAFVTLNFLLALLVAAAIVVPVVLIVLPRQRQAANQGRTGGACATTSPCLNGGLSVQVADGCGCICRNGFTGNTCDVAADPGCVTSEVKSGAMTVDQATVGSAIPRLFENSLNNYSIPLNGTKILTLFSAGNLSCTSENALVSFNDKISKRETDQVPELELEPSSASSFVPAAVALATPVARLEDRQVGTSFGIVFQVSTSAEPEPTAGSRQSSNASDAQPAAPTGGAGRGNADPTQETFDFARVSVLYVLEQTGDLQTALQAQDSMKMFFSDRTSFNDTITFRSQGQDLNLNFTDFSIRIGRNDVVGGLGDGEGGMLKGS